MIRSLFAPSLCALAALSLLPARTALAGSSSCGGGGSDSGSDSGGSSSDSSSDSSSSASDSSSSSAAPACSDATDIVGYRRCLEFGAWRQRGGTGAIAIDLGVSVRSFASPLREADGHLSHESESFTYRVVSGPSRGEAPAPDTAVVSTLRIAHTRPSGLFIGAHGELGGLARNQSHAEMTSAGTFGAPSIDAGSALYTSALGVAGIRGSAGRATLGAELAGGVRRISYTYTSHYLSCVTSTTHAVSTPILEARAQAQLWLSPFVNVGVHAGASLTERGAWVGGVHFGFASRAFGDQRQ